MDAAGVYPRRWVRDGADHDQLGTIKLFGAKLSRVNPAPLHVSVLERRASLAKRHGTPVALEPGLAAAAGV